MSGEQAVLRIAEKYYRGNEISAADRLLGDFRKGLLGSGSLECVSDAPVYENVKQAGLRKVDDDDKDIDVKVNQLAQQTKPVEKPKRKPEKPVEENPDQRYFYEGGIESIEPIEPEVLKKLQAQLAKEEARQARKEERMSASSATESSTESTVPQPSANQTTSISAKDIGKGGFEEW